MTRTKSRFPQSLMIVASLVCCFLMTQSATAQKGKGGKGGGGGGGETSTGGDTIANPAFVFKKSGSDALHLLTHDGGQQLQISQPRSGDTDIKPVWSPDGSQLAFFRIPSKSSSKDLYVISLFEDENGVDPSQSTESLVASNVQADFGSGQGNPSWSITNELVVAHEQTLYTIDMAATNPIQLPLFDFRELETLPVPEGFASDTKITIFRIYTVDVQPVASNDKVIVAFLAEWTVHGDNEYYSQDVLLMDADISSGYLVVDPNTIRNLTNPNYLPTGFSPYFYPWIDWSEDGTNLAFLEEYDIYDVDPRGQRQITAWNVPTNTMTPVIVGSPDDDSAAPNLEFTWSPDGEEIALGVGTPVKGGHTYDVFRVPADQFAYPIRGSESVNVTNTLRGSAREAEPRWRPTWVRQ